MLPYKRAERVSRLLKEELSDIMLNRLKDPRMGFITVTDVKVTDDLKLARVYISVLRDEEKEKTIETLNSAKSFIRSELGKRIKLRSTPELDFRLDTTAEYGANIEKLLREIKPKDE